MPSTWTSRQSLRLPWPTRRQGRLGQSETQKKISAVNSSQLPRAQHRRGGAYLPSRHLNPLPLVFQKAITFFPVHKYCTSTLPFYPPRSAAAALGNYTPTKAMSRQAFSKAVNSPFSGTSRMPCRGQRSTEARDGSGIHSRTKPRGQFGHDALGEMILDTKEGKAGDSASASGERTFSSPRSLWCSSPRSSPPPRRSQHQHFQRSPYEMEIGARVTGTPDPRDNWHLTTPWDATQDHWESWTTNSEAGWTCSDTSSTPQQSYVGDWMRLVPNYMTVDSQDLKNRYKCDIDPATSRFIDPVRHEEIIPNEPLLKGEFLDEEARQQARLESFRRMNCCSNSQMCSAISKLDLDRMRKAI